MLREQLAAAYRICAMHRFNEGVCNHLTVAVDCPRASQGAQSHPRALIVLGSASLVIAHGLDWSEVTPESLVPILTA